MIKVENIEVWGFEHAIRGMRNPLNSWDTRTESICYFERYKKKLATLRTQATKYGDKK